MERFQTVSRARADKYAVSPAKQTETEISVAPHLGSVGGLCNGRLMEKNYVEKADETHFMINVDSGYTLRLSGYKEVKHADFVSGGEKFAMLLRLIGDRNTHIAALLMIFKNLDCNDSIENVPDTVPRVAYRIGKKSSMNRKVTRE